MIKTIVALRQLAKDQPVGTSGSFAYELLSYAWWILKPSRWPGWFRKYIY